MAECCRNHGCGRTVHSGPVWASEEVEFVPCWRELYGVTSNIW